MFQHATEHENHNWFGELQFYNAEYHHRGQAHKHVRKPRQDDRRCTSRTHRVGAFATESSWTLWHIGGVPARTPTEYQCFHGGRPWVARNQLHTTNTKSTRPRYTAPPFGYQHGVGAGSLKPQNYEAATKLGDKNTFTSSSQVQERPNRKPSPRF